MERTCKMGGLLSVLVTTGTLVMYASSEEKMANCDQCSTPSLSPEQVRSFRIEMIKNQILTKLRLPGPPPVEQPMEVLPPVLLQQMKKKNRIEEFQATEDEGISAYFAKTMEMILFPEIETRCPAKVPTACLRFNFKQVPPGSAIKSARIWIYKEATSTVEDLPTFTLSAHQLLPRDISLQANALPGWLQFSLGHSFIRWLHNRQHRRARRTFKVSCASCFGDPGLPPIPLIGQYRPFLEVTFSPAKKRVKRTTRLCVPGMTSCCKEKLRFKFTDINWNFVVEPQYYDDYYCKGSCAGSGTSSFMTNHSMVMHALRRVRPDAVPCCAPAKLASMSMLYNEKGTYKYVTLNDMRVVHCGCA